MLATTFGLFGGLGGSVALLTVLAYESYIIHRLLERSGVLGVISLTTVFAGLIWAFMAYGRPWMLYHFGEVGYWIGFAVVAAPTLLFFLQASRYVFNRFRKQDPGL